MARSRRTKKRMIELVVILMLIAFVGVAAVRSGFQRTAGDRAHFQYFALEHFLATRSLDPSLTWTAQKTSSRLCYRMSWPLSQGLECWCLSLGSKLY